MQYERIDWAAPRTDAEWKILAEGLRAHGRGNRQEAHDSFERCDTDGFLSQWASSITGSAYELAAQIADDHGWIEVRALFTLDGEFLSADLRDGKFGMYWLVDRDTASKHGLSKPFINKSTASSPVVRAKNYAKKGFAVGTIRIRPYVTLAGGNAASVRAVVLPDNRALRNRDFEIIRTRHGDLFDSTAPNSSDWRFWAPEELAAKLGEAV